MEMRQRKQKSASELLLPTDDSDVRFKSAAKRGFLFRCTRFLFLSLLVVAAALSAMVAFVHYFVQSPIQAQVYDMGPLPAFEGAWAVNDRLTKGERIMHNEILGPESLLLDGDTIYAGTMDGRVVQIQRRVITREVRFGQQPCGGYWNEPTCGRPLGIRMSPRNSLIVADAYLGLFEVDIWSNTSTQLVKGGSLVDGRPLKFLNDVEVLPDGTILFTDSSSSWDRRRFPYIFMEQKAEGRLLSYDPTTKALSVLLDGLYFANGVQLSLDKKSLLVAECSMARILRYHLEGARKGKTEVFAENLPGFPDNIRLSSNGSYWVGFAAVRHRHAFSFADYAASRPWLREFILKIIPASQLQALLSRVLKPHGLVAMFDEGGRVLQSLHDPDGRVIPDASQVTDAGAVLFFGSFHNSFIGKLAL